MTPTFTIYQDATGIELWIGETTDERAAVAAYMDEVGVDADADWGGVKIAKVIGDDYGPRREAADYL